MKFTQPVDAAVARQPSNHFAQCWNYRYSAAYGSPEFSPSHSGVVGHDTLAIATAYVLPDGRSVFLELPDLQPVNQLHLHLRVNEADPAQDLFLTVHRLDVPFAAFPGYRPTAKVIAAHPILADLALATMKRCRTRGGSRCRTRTIAMVAGKNLTFATPSFTVKAGEPLRLTFANPDVVPHNWVLIKPGTLERVGDLTNKLVADPEAVVRHYVPASADVLANTDIVPPRERFTIWFRTRHERPLSVSLHLSGSLDGDERPDGCRITLGKRRGCWAHVPK